MRLGSIKKALHWFLQKNTTVILQVTLFCVHALLDWQVFSTWLTCIEKVEIPAGREGTSGLASRTHTRTQKKDWGRGRGGVHLRLWFVRIFWEEVNTNQAVKQTGGHRVGIESMSGSSDVGSSSFLWKVEQSSSSLGFASFSHTLAFFPAEL